MEEKILVSLGQGQSQQDLARALLDLADDPHDVETSPRQGGFMVPESLAGRYATAVEAAADAETSPAKKAAPRPRRGRATTASDTSAATETAQPKKATKAAARPARSRKASDKKASKASPAGGKGQASSTEKGGEGVSDA